MASVPEQKRSKSIMCCEKQPYLDSDRKYDTLPEKKIGESPTKRNKIPSKIYNIKNAVL